MDREGAEGDYAEYGDGPLTQGKVGRLGPHPHRRRTLRHSQHIQFPEAGVHLFCEPSPGPPTDLLGSDGDRHRQVLLCVYISAVRFRVRNEPVTVVLLRHGEECLLFQPRFNHRPAGGLPQLEEVL
ncbi:hypothetical protein TNCV_1119851 [Trichonephila clavipes]|uniref:Uncharacterized protein n=1 Tax=Trichonephila clavipes TaxID=2585209 RepID=A0A8X6T5L7_TRICX|nr:hypothetical protein TNCV_1119851 [Trichonephila clavipes]